MRRRASTICLLFSLLILGCGLTICPGIAQIELSSLKEEQKENVPAESPQASLSNLLRQVSQEMAALNTGTNASAEVTRQAEKLRQIQKLAEEQLRLVTEVSRNIPPLPEERPDLAGKGPPWSVLVLDQFRAQIHLRRAYVEKQRAVVEDAVQEADYAQKQLAQRQQELRALKEAASPVGEQLVRGQDDALEIRLLEQETGVQKLRLKRRRQEIELTEKELTALEHALVPLRKKAHFPEADFQDILVQLDQREANLRRQTNNQLLELRPLEAGAMSPTSVAAIREHRRLMEEAEERLRLVEPDRATWQRRYDLFNREVPIATRRTWRDESRQRVLRLERLLRVKHLRIVEIKEQIRGKTADKGTEEQNAGSDVRLLNAVELALAALQRSRDLENNLVADLDLFSATAPIRTFWTGIWARVLRAWRFEIASIDERPVTVRKVVLALLFLLIGLRVVKWVSRRIIQRLLHRAWVAESTSIAISTLMFYLMAVIVSVIALGTAGIPLTLFTLLGGALAIGLGFGSQNLINNFISGLILLIERPIRVNDMVEVNNTYGKITHVGLRCTQVRTFSNIDIMVPNSTFLESNVTNWTLTDDLVRAELFVGVIYGSPVEKARALLLEAARAHEKVLSTPAPEVMFMDFGDSALILRLYVWVRMRSPADRDRVLSDLRFSTDTLFRENNLVIAFPQRDVHMNTAKPLEIRMVRDKPDD